jgi:hypothetical protein
MSEKLGSCSCSVTIRPLRPGSFCREQPSARQRSRGWAAAGPGPREAAAGDHGSCRRPAVCGAWSRAALGPQRRRRHSSAARAGSRRRSGRGAGSWACGAGGAARAAAATPGRTAPWCSCGVRAPPLPPSTPAAPVPAPKPLSPAHTSPRPCRPLPPPLAAVP